MTEPRLHHITCPDAHGGHRMAYWEWNATGLPHHPHVVVCVHGLSRQGRDFDTLARALSTHARVVSVDVAGRGQSDWLKDPAAYQVPTYAGRHAGRARAPAAQARWTGLAPAWAG